MKYYLVALFDENSYEHIETIQKDICKKYKLYKKLPVLHITLETIEDPDLELFDKTLLDILKPYKNFKVDVNDVLCFDAPYKSVNLKVENKGYIIRIARHINEKLKLQGFKVRDRIDDWDLHISLANTNYAIRNWSKSEYSTACESTKNRNFNAFIRIEKIELWKPINNKKSMVVKSYALKQY